MPGHPHSNCPSCPQELDELYQDAAGNVLVAICKHSWPGVTRHLEAPVLSGVFPHRSLLYVLGVLSSVGTWVCGCGDMVMWASGDHHLCYQGSLP